MLISEIATMAGLSKDGIRHYEALGLIASAPRKAGSRTYRDYDPSVLDTVEKIRQAQRLGLSLKEIAPLLKAYTETPPSTEQVVQFLEERLAVIREKIAALQEVEAFIGQKIDRYRPPPAEDYGCESVPPHGCQDYAGRAAGKQRSMKR